MGKGAGIWNQNTALNCQKCGLFSESLIKMFLGKQNNDSMKGGKRQRWSVNQLPKMGEMGRIISLHPYIYRLWAGEMSTTVDILVC
jgi:hypothetical protein